MNIKSRLDSARRAVETLQNGFQNQVHLNMAPYGPEQAFSELNDVANNPASTPEWKNDAIELIAKLRQKFPGRFPE